MHILADEIVHVVCERRHITGVTAWLLEGLAIVVVIFSMYVLYIIFNNNPFSKKE